MPTLEAIMNHTLAITVLREFCGAGCSAELLGWMAGGAGDSTGNGCRICVESSATQPGAPSFWSGFVVRRCPRSPISAHEGEEESRGGADTDLGILPAT